MTLRGWQVTVEKVERVGQSCRIAGTTLFAPAGKEILVLTLTLQPTGDSESFTERLSIVDRDGNELGKIDQWGPEPDSESGAGTLSHPMPIFIDLNSRPHRLILAKGVEVALPQAGGAGEQ